MGRIGNPILDIDNEHVHADLMHGSNQIQRTLAIEGLFLWFDRYEVWVVVGHVHEIAKHRRSPFSIQWSLPHGLHS